MSPLHGAIQWESLAGTHSHNSTERHVFGQHAPPTSIGLLYVSILRNHCHQTLDRATGTIHRTGFDGLGHRIQRHHHSRFRPLADDEAVTRYRHQRTDVQGVPDAMRADPAIDRKPGQRDGGYRQCHACDLRRQYAGPCKIQSFGNEGEQQGRDQPSPAGPKASGNGCIHVLIVFGRQHFLRLKAAPRIALIAFSNARSSALISSCFSTRLNCSRWMPATSFACGGSRILRRAIHVGNPEGMGLWRIHGRSAKRERPV